jgi:hypothetical protein
VTVHTTLVLLDDRVVMAHNENNLQSAVYNLSNVDFGYNLTKSLSRKKSIVCSGQ